MSHGLQWNNGEETANLKHIAECSLHHQCQGGCVIINTTFGNGQCSSFIAKVMSI